MYKSAWLITLSGVPESSRITLAESIPRHIRRSPRTAPNVRIVWSMSLICSLFFCPIKVASAAFGPTDSPTIRFTKIPTSATQLPTAASAVSPAKRPTTATSAELNSCCKILLNARGIANRISFPAIPPFSISISLDFAAFSISVFQSFLFLIPLVYIESVPERSCGTIYNC